MAKPRQLDRHAAVGSQGLLVMMFHNACASEKTVLHLSSLVPPEPASRNTPARVQ
jgi:hypothetical protein